MEAQLTPQIKFMNIFQFKEGEKELPKPDVKDVKPKPVLTELGKGHHGRDNNCVIC